MRKIAACLRVCNSNKNGFARDLTTLETLTARAALARPSGHAARPAGETRNLACELISALPGLGRAGFEVVAEELAMPSVHT